MHYIYFTYLISERNAGLKLFILMFLLKIWCFKRTSQQLCLFFLLHSRGSCLTDLKSFCYEERFFVVLSTPELFFSCGILRPKLCPCLYSRHSCRLDMLRGHKGSFLGMMLLVAFKTEHLVVWWWVIFTVVVSKSVQAIKICCFHSF